MFVVTFKAETEEDQGELNHCWPLPSRQKQLLSNFTSYRDYPLLIHYKAVGEKRLGLTSFPISEERPELYTRKVFKQYSPWSY